MNVKKIVGFVVTNRRTIGIIIGGLMTLFGHQDLADYTVGVTSL